MKIIKKILHKPLFCLLPLLALAWFWIIPAKLNINNIELTIDGNSYPESIPLSTNKIAENSNFSISFNIDVENNKNSVYKFYPDDCILGIEINGKAFPQKTIKKPCDYNNGIMLDLSEYTQKGLNRIKLQMKNDGGPGGLRIESPNGIRALSLKHYIFTLLLLLSIALILRKFKFGFIAISIILLGIIVRLIVYTYMGPMQSPHDIEAHLHYMQIIAEEKRIPKNDECWVCYQPPPYYVASAVVKNVVDSYDPVLTGRILQQGQLLFSFASIIFGVALILNLFGNNRLAYLASIISVFWTGFAIAGPRINNDIEFYFGALFCMLFAQRYWLTHKNLDMFLASLGASIALASKSTGFVILAVWVVVYVLCTVRFLKIGSLRALLASAFTVLLFIGISNHRTIIDIFEGKKIDIVGNGNSLHGGLRVNNTAGNYLYLDLKDYLLIPGTSAWVDEGGRQYFWNYAIKSSLYLSHDIALLKSPAGRTLITALCALALLIFVFALWGTIHAKYRELPAVLFAISLFSALMYLRINYPYSCSNEFRYIFPVIFPLAYFSVRGVHILENFRLKILAYTSMLFFAILSLLFILIPAF